MRGFVARAFASSGSGKAQTSPQAQISTPAQSQLHAQPESQTRAAAAAAAAAGAGAGAGSSVAASHPGKSNVPTFSLESAAPPSFLAPAVTAPPASGSLSARGSTRDPYLGPKYHVLIVDDSALTRKMLAKTLKAAGHGVVEAEDGLQGVVRLETALKDGGRGEGAGGDGGQHAE